MSLKHEILKVLYERKEPMSTTEIAKILGKLSGTINNLVKIEIIRGTIKQRVGAPEYYITEYGKRSLINSGRL